MPTYKYRLLGTGTKNRQGIANLSKDPNEDRFTGYTGVGAGKIDIIASDTSDPKDLDAIISNPKTILDCINYDKATTNDHNDSMWSNTTRFIRGDVYTRIEKQSTAAAVNTPITDNNCIEFDLLMNPQPGSTQLITIRESTTVLYAITRNNIGFQTGEWNHLIITVIDGVVTATNETTGVTTTSTITTPDNIALRVLTNDDTYFKEFKVYPV